MQVFHGSPARGIVKFELRESRFESLEGTGLYCTLDYRVARKYAGSEGSVYKCELLSTNVFDATEAEEFETLFTKLSKAIGFKINSCSNFNKLVSFFVKGQYQITDEQNTGLYFQIERFLENDEIFVEKFQDETSEIYEKIKIFLNEYMSQFSIMKYNSGDSKLGLVYIVRNCDLISILEEIEIGSDKDIDNL